MDTNERSGLCARMVREMDPYAVPVTSIGGHNRLPTGYANKSLHTRLTASACNGISDYETSGSPSDMPKVVPVSGQDDATETYGASVGLDADRSSDDNSRRIQLVPGDVGRARQGAELQAERAPTLPPLLSPPPPAPAGRPVLCQLPGRFRPIHSAARSGAKDRPVPSRKRAFGVSASVPDWGGHSACPSFPGSWTIVALVRGAEQEVSSVSRRSVHLPGEGFLTGDGRFYSEGEVRAALLSLCEWWVGLSAEERSGLLEAAELAEIDREVDAAVLGSAT